MALSTSDVIKRVLQAKALSKLTFTDIGKAIGVTNVYAAQLFHNQAQLKPHTALKLQALFEQHRCPLHADDLHAMQQAPMRSWEDNYLKEPSIYRFVEAFEHFGESLKQVSNEKFGDGIMSAIDFFVTMEKVKGGHGEDRVLVTFNGKFLQHSEMRTDDAHATANPPTLAAVPEGPLVYEPPVTVLPLRGAQKQGLVNHLHCLKNKARLTFDQLGQHLGVTNLYAAQLLNNQAQLKPHTAAKLQAVLPGLTPAVLSMMALPPMRSWDPTILQEPNVYRTLEGCKHHALGLKAVLNEEFGDGIMSAIDFYMAVRRARGPHGEPRVVITLNGKFLPHVEQEVGPLQGMTYED